MNFNILPIKISEISFDMEGQSVSIQGKITDIYKTSGPLVLEYLMAMNLDPVVFNPVEDYYSP